MKSTASLILTCTLASIMLGGCASTQTESRVFIMPSSSTISLGTLEPVHTNATKQNGPVFQLGAGDALGQQIYANYAVIARANAGWQYANAEVMTDDME